MQIPEGYSVDTKPKTWQEGDYTVHRTTAWSAPGCHQGCGVLVYVKDGQIDKVMGDPDHPANEGRLCPRCVAFPKVLNHKDRLKYPLKRVGERGENKWERITWDEALDTIERETKKIIDEYGPSSLVGFTGTGRDAFWVIGRLMNTMGSGNCSGGLSGNSCYMPRAVAGVATVGSLFPVADCAQYFEDRYDHPEWKVPEIIVNWGCNPVISNPDYFMGSWIVECMKRGSKLINIDPRMTWMSARADVWVQIRPGTDPMYAVALLKIIIEEDLYDHEYVEKWCSGFDELREHLKQFDLDYIAEHTWIPKEKIQMVARMFAKAECATFELGLALDMSRYGIFGAQAAIQILALTGNLDAPGGGILPVVPFNLHATVSGGWGRDEYVTEEDREKSIGHAKYPVMKYGLPLCSPDELVVQLNTQEPYPLKAGFILATNMLTGHGMDPLYWHSGMKKLDFIVGIDIFMNPTLVALADIVLPACTWAEKNSIRSQFYYMATMNKIIEPLGESKPDFEIARLIGRRFNTDAWPETEEENLDKECASSGLTFKELQEINISFPYNPYHKCELGMLRADGEPGFNTPSGKVELYSHFFEQFGVPPMPIFEETVYGPYSSPELFAKYPLIMMTGVRSKAAFHSEHRQIAMLREIVSDPFVEIHPDYAKEQCINDGEWVWVENQKDRIRQRAKVTQAVHPKMCLTHHAWWFPEKEAAEPSLYGMWEVNNNRLIDMGNVGVSGFGADVKCCLCKVYKMKEGEM